MGSMKQPEKGCCLDQKPNNLLERDRHGTKQGGNEEEKSCFWANQGQMSWIIREKKSAAKKYWYIDISELFVEYLDKYLEASAFIYILEPSPGSWWFATFDKAEYWVLILDAEYWVLILNTERLKRDTFDVVW